ncbi:hypothetical protein NFI96_001500 [Prochilodus magdalenae]|nr:hypothetical protein NFI96_001500 [Prochilodus magdalenae]
MVAYIADASEPPPSRPFVPFALVTFILLHIIVAVVYHTKRSKGCRSGYQRTNYWISQHIQEGQYCCPATALPYRPNLRSFSWRKYEHVYTQQTQEEISSESEPPQSLPFVPFALVTVIFLHIIVAVVYYTSRTKGPARVHYSTADGDGVAALWRTENNYWISQHIQEGVPTIKPTAVVNVHTSPPTSVTNSSQISENNSPPVYVFICIPVSLLLMGLGGIIYWRCGGRRRGQTESQEQRRTKREEKSQAALWRTENNYWISQHIQEGCTLENSERLLTITAHTGGSVLLPCSCTDLQTKPENFTWKKRNRNTQTWEEISSESGQYGNRVQLFNDHSPGNLSLLISHLTEEDAGGYQCAVKGSLMIIRLTIEEATQLNAKESCTPAQFTGKTADQAKAQPAVPTNRMGRRNTTSPTRPVCTTKFQEPPQSLPFVPFALVTVILLHIIVAVVYYTSRTKGPARVYYSIADGDGVEIPLTLTSRGAVGLDYLKDHLVTPEPPQSLPFIPFALMTVILLHIIVAVVYYTSRTKGCILENRGRLLTITAHTRGSVLLPCSCTDLQTKPETVIWMKYNGKKYEAISIESDQYGNRVQLVNGHSPGNLSLLISHLTEEDGGGYQCYVKVSHMIISLTIKEGTPTPTPSTASKPTTSTAPKPTPSTAPNPTPSTAVVKVHTSATTSAAPSATCSSQSADEPPPLPFVPFALVTVILLHIIVAVVYYTSRIKGPARVYYSIADGDGVQGRENNEEVHMTSPYVAAACVHKTGNSCTLVNSEKPLVDITAHTGGSVLLPCSCTDLQTKPKGLIWRKYNESALLDMSLNSDLYKNRVQLFNGLSPGNLSLLISHLTEEDGGEYECSVEGSHIRIRLTVKGCTLVNSEQQLQDKQPLPITAHTGGSVLLPCSCTDLQSKPEEFTWKKDNRNTQTREPISRESDQYRNRVQLFNDHSPGNLSLLISHLTEEDGGVYWCAVKDSHIIIRLTVEDTDHPIHFFILIPVLLLLLGFGGVIYWRYRGRRRGQTESEEQRRLKKGCTLEDHQQIKTITSYTGESVLLPCYCTDLKTKPETFIWKKYHTSTQRWEEISSESGQYRNRVQLVNDHSPGNLSLLISHLTEEDGGDYRCTVQSGGFTDISLTVKGCSLTDRGQTPSITAHRGGSVLLPCSCTELRAKPETFTWTRYNQKRNVFERISNESDQYRNRVQLVNDHSPGNLSLLISHLTEEDGGMYRCHGVKSGLTDIRLTVEEPPVPLPFVPYALVTVIILHIIVAVVYCRTKGCTLTGSGKQLTITAHRGGSVLLPCSCTELRAKPETFTWRRYNQNRKGYERISIESDRYRNRVQLVNDHSPGNLSLLISHLTGEDGGDYRCDGVKSGYTDIRLTVEGNTLICIPTAKCAESAV